MPDREFGRRARNDALFVIAILALSLVAFLIFRATLRVGNVVTVSVGGEEKYRYSIEENREFAVKTGQNGEGINTVVIKDGKVSMKSANCPDKLCVKHRVILNDGETIVCLPHKLVVAVVTE